MPILKAFPKAHIFLTHSQSEYKCERKLFSVLFSPPAIVNNAAHPQLTATAAGLKTAYICMHLYACICKFM